MNLVYFKLVSLSCLKREPAAYWLIFLAMLTLVCNSCKKEDSGDTPVYLTVNLANTPLQNGCYYAIHPTARTFVLEFNSPLDTLTVKGNLSFKDNNGLLDDNITLRYSDRKILVLLNPGFFLKAGWQYSITVGTGVRSLSGLKTGSPVTLDLRTASGSLHESVNPGQRDGILCISDIHMGEARATDQHYGWFSNNAAALADLLDLALTAQQVRQVVILGDLFDEWVVPFRMAPFDSLNGITDSRGYFLSVAGNPVNTPVIARLKEIAASDSIQLIYVPGNHDMLLTKEILGEIIPGVTWAGSVPGLGEYSPVNGIIMEHGHRYDFFNTPQPLVQPGHILPPGYYISRLQAEGLKEKGRGIKKGTAVPIGSPEFLLSWTVAFTYLEVTYSMTVNPDSANIVMNGIDSTQGLFSFNGIRDHYAQSIESVWNATQTMNEVPLALPVSMALLDGTGGLYPAAVYEYFSSTAPVKYKMAVMGHTHVPEIKVYPAGSNYQAIYANSGSWVNADLTSKPVRTYLLIRPGAWTGSGLDIVSLYQYNPDDGSSISSAGYTSVLLAEESVAR